MQVVKRGAARKGLPRDRVQASRGVTGGPRAWWRQSRSGESFGGGLQLGVLLEEVGVGLARTSQLADQGPEAFAFLADEPVGLDDALRELLQGAPRGLVRVALLRGPLRASSGEGRGASVECAQS